MTTPSLLRTGAAAVLLTSLVTGCASSGTLGVPPGAILSTVIANLPVITSTIGGTTTTSTSRSPSTSRSRRIPSSPPPSARAARILDTGDRYLGVPYVWGGTTPRGFDCSGFTKYIFAKQGIALPRTSREQSHVGTAIRADFASLLPGDLMFFAEPGEAISHVAIYAGDGRILHSSSSVGGVGYTDLNVGGDWFVAYFVAARRIGG